LGALETGLYTQNGHGIAKMIFNQPYLTVQGIKICIASGRHAFVSQRASKNSPSGRCLYARSTKKPPRIMPGAI